MKKNNKRIHSPELSEALEDRLRPSRFLGYDRDHLGIALLRREMFEAAESQFRRACYLNPYNAAFLHHLAWCLYKMDRLEEAAAYVEKSIQMDPGDGDAYIVRERILKGKAR